MDSICNHSAKVGRTAWAATVLTLSMLCTGCSNPVSSTDASGIQSQSYGGAVNPTDQTAVPDIPPASADALSSLPHIDAGARQYSDTNVLVTLSGTVDLLEDAEIADVYWVQVDGPPAYIAEPTALETAVVIPDLTEVALLRFLLVASDQSGRTNAASTTVVVTPQPAFARVAGAVVDPDSGLATFKIRLSNPVPEPVTINYQTVEGTALENLDYLPQTDEVTFAANETEREVPVELLQNPSRASARDFSLRITSNLGEESFFNSGVMVIAGTPQFATKPELLFAEAGPVRMIAGETFFNPFEDDWPELQEADVHYFSSDSQVASVDAQGLVTALNAGTATINAVIPANELQDESTAAYIVQVDPIDVIEQQIYFTQPGPVEIRIDETLSNPVSTDSNEAPGTGAISYRSENVEIARVDDEGNIEPAAAGETVITATKAADDHHGAATASYALRISLLPQTVSVTEPEIEIAVGQSTTNPVATAEDITGSGELIWTSSDPAIARVDDGGTLTGVAPGEVEITVEKAADNRYAATSTAFDVVVSPAELLGQSIGFTTPGIVDALITDTVVNPLDEVGSGTGSISYESSDPDIVTVDNDGQVELLAPGRVTITAVKAGDDEYLPATASYDLRVSLVPQNLIFGQDTLQVEIGATATNSLYEYSLPPGTGILSYVSSDPAVASVEADGTVTGQATGTATITVSKAADGVYDASTNTFTVEVIKKPLLTQTLQFESAGPLKVSIGDTIINPVVLGPDNGTGEVKYTSEDTDVAQVAADGSLTLLTAGSTTVTAAIAADEQYAGATASYKLKVSLISQPIEFPVSLIYIAVGQTVEVPLQRVEDYFDSRHITFSSSDESIATVGTTTKVDKPRDLGIVADSLSKKRVGGNAVESVYLRGVSPGGPVTITATAEASDTLAASSASIQVIVTAPVEDPVWSTGSGVIRGTWSWDLDFGGDEVGTDMWWRQRDDTVRVLIPEDGAQLAVLGMVDFDSITFQQLQQLSYSSDSIDGSDTSSNRLPTGTVVAAITDQGRYSKFQIVEYGYNLQIRWVTYGESDLH